MTIILSIFLFFTPAWAKSFMPNSFSANYEETVASVTGKEKKTFGKIDYKYPGNIRLEVTSPDPTTFVANPNQSWFYTPPFVEGEQGQVTIQKSSKLPLTKFLDGIQSGIENSKLFKPSYQGKDLKLSFDPKVEKEMTLKEVILHAEKDAKNVQSLADFQRLTLIYADGRKVNLRFIELRENTSFASGHFTFQVPPKTKITNN
jgi:outer membrane lipoprotein-sorting protein